MKRGIKRTLVLLLLSLVFVLAACGENAGSGSYTVTFSYNYADAPEAEEKSVAAGETVSAPESDPTRDNYVFTGWYTDSLGISEYDFDTPVTQDLRLFAGWQLSVCTVRFETSGGTEIASQAVEIGETASRPDTDPELEDYEFVDWYADASYKTLFDFDEPITGNTVVYAKWKQVRATVTFYWYEGVTETVKVDLSDETYSVVSRPAEDPTREDYAFVDWYADAACTELYSFSTYVTGDITIYAGWQLTVATVTFDQNYDGWSADDSDSVKVKVGESVSEPDTPERTGYEFAGWYTDSDCTEEYDFSSQVTDNMTLYADWEREEYEVTFSLNGGSGDIASQTVTYGDTVTQPDTDPERSGYVFSGWYVDADCTEEFDFDTIISEDTVIYAGWVRSSSSENPVVTFSLNYDGLIYDEVEVTSGSRVSKPDDPERDKYYFDGWYTDSDCTSSFKFSSTRVTSDITLYARWLRKYTFEAEYVNLEGKLGQGSSDNVSGTQLILSEDSTTNDMGTSNGYWLGKLYYNGAYVDFEINAEEDVSDVVLILRLTPDLYDMSFTDETWQIIVNGERIEYGSLELTDAVSASDGGNTVKRPFQDYEIGVRIALNEGANTIRFYTNNSNSHGGTFAAETPLIDCIYLCSAVELSWAECHPENVGQTMDDVEY